MIERITGPINPEYQEDQFYLGTVYTGMVYCDLFSDKNDISEWLSSESPRFRRSKPGSFEFFRKASLDSELKASISVFLENNSYVRVEQSGKNIFWVEGPLDEERFRERIPHVVFNLAEGVRQKELGIITVHAAAVLREEKGLLILGDKGAGKTSLLLSLCLNNGFVFLGNDLLLLQQGNPPTVVCGNQNIDIRYSIKNTIKGLNERIGDHQLYRGPYEDKIQVFPEDIGLDVADSSVPIKTVVRVNIHQNNPDFSFTRQVPKDLEVLRLYENFSRYVRGITTPVYMQEGEIRGYFPSLDSCELSEMRGRIIRRLLNDTPFFYINGNSPEEVAEGVNDLLRMT